MPKITAVSVHSFHQSFGSVAKPRASWLVIGSVIGLTACGGGGSTQTPGATTTPGTPVTMSSAATSDGADETVSPTAGTETGATAKVLPIAGGTAAVVALFPDGRAYYSPDGFNLAGGGSTVAAYSGSLKIIDIVALSTGVDALLSDGSVFFSPDGRNLGGGGASSHAYEGTLKVASLTQVGSGVDAVFLGGGGAYYSPDGHNLGGGGSSVSIYNGSRAIVQIVAVGSGDAVVTLFSDGTTFYSPNNRDIGGGGNTVSATSGVLSPIMELFKVGGGILAEVGDGTIYLSSDGMNLTGGGHTVVVPAWTALGNGPFQARDSAHGAMFLDRLWLSGGFDDPTSSDSCFNTCSYFDLWSSTDLEGATWNSIPTFATSTTPDPRDATPVVNSGVQDAPLPSDFYDSYSALVVWNNQLTAIGSTVWRSADGVKWLRNNLADGVTAAPGPVPARATENSRAEILGTTLFFLQMDTGKIYSSTDVNAALWTDLGFIRGFTPRCGAAAFTLLGRIWIVGGGACDYSKIYNDVWSSADGINWTQSATLAQWSGRMWPCAATSSDGVVWLAGGYAPTDWNNTSGLAVRYSANHADVWYSKDGSDWRQFKADIGSGVPDDGTLEARHAPTCYVTEDAATSRRLVIMAGTGGIDPDDRNARVLNSIRALPLPSAATLP